MMPATSNGAPAGATPQVKPEAVNAVVDSLANGDFDEFPDANWAQTSLPPSDSWENGNQVVNDMSDEFVKKIKAAVTSTTKGGKWECETSRKCIYIELAARE